MGFTTATMIAEQRQDMIQVSTGCKEFDEVLAGEVGLNGWLLSVAVLLHLSHINKPLACRWH